MIERGLRSIQRRQAHATRPIRRVERRGHRDQQCHVTAACRDEGRYHAAAGVAHQHQGAPRAARTRAIDRVVDGTNGRAGEPMGRPVPHGHNADRCGQVRTGRGGPHRPPPARDRRRQVAGRADRSASGPRRACAGRDRPRRRPRYRQTAGPNVCHRAGRAANRRRRRATRRVRGRRPARCWRRWHRVSARCDRTLQAAPTPARARRSGARSAGPLRRR